MKKTYLAHARKLQTSWAIVHTVEALCPDDPRNCQMDARFQPRQSSGSVVPAKGVRTHPPMVLSAMVREIKQLTFYQVSQAYLPPCVKVHIYSIRSSAFLFNGRETFWLVMMPLGGGRTIITLRAADKDRGRRRGCQRSWEAPQLSEIVGSNLPSFLSFRSTGGGTWAVSGCRNDVVRLAYFSQRSGQTYPDRICWSSGCDMEVVRIRCLRVSCASP